MTTTAGFPGISMRSLPTFPTFAKLEQGHQPIIERCTQQFPPYSDYTFPSLWCWNEGNVLEVAELHGNLVVKFRDYFSKEPFFSFLGNQRVVETIDALLAFAAQADGYLPRLQFVPAHNLLDSPLGPAYQVEADRDNADYVYSVSELAAMAGRKYQVHRNFINRFNKTYAWEARLLDLRNDQDWQDILRVLASWQANKAEGGMEVGVDIHAIQALRGLLPQVAVLAVGVYVDGVLCGYTINELNQQRYATNLFEHGDTMYIGIFRVLKQQTCLRLQQLGYEYWNHQQDSGFLGLRQAKESFQPSLYLQKLTIQAAGGTT